MENIVTYIQMGLAVLLVAGILIQQKGAGLSSTFGGSGLEYSTKRGAEKIIFYATVAISILFVAVSVYRVSIS